MAFRVRADYQNHAIGWLQRIQFPLRWGGGTIGPKLDVNSSGHPGNLGSDGQAAIRPWWPTIAFDPLEKCTHHGPTPLFPWLNRHCSKRKLHDVSYRAGL